MKPSFRNLSLIARSPHLLFHHVPIQPSKPLSLSFPLSSNSTSQSQSQSQSLSELFSHHHLSDDLRTFIADLAAELSDTSDPSAISHLLDSKAFRLFRSHPDCSASLELLHCLKSSPHAALQVFHWKKQQNADTGFPMVSEEYAKAIALAGRIKNVELAVNLFLEAGARRFRNESVYNALMATYVYNGLTKRSLSLFEDLKRDPTCRSTIVTYNILLSIFGRSMLVSHMETVLQAIKDSNLTPTLHTYNTMIAGYLTAWMWDDMERVFYSMEDSPVRPDTRTHLLMLRGYAHSVNLEKMERTYELVEEEVNERNPPLIRAMICAYCKSSDPNRVQKVETLIHLLPKGEYRPWLNVLLIRLCAQENLVEGMESFICEALRHNTSVVNVAIMNAIISSYFRCNAVDRLARFVKLAEDAGWRLCRSLYHCKMVCYGVENRLGEMERVLGEMEVSRFVPTKKTFLIMYKAYLRSGDRLKVELILGFVCKLGFGIPMDASTL